jgi:DnaJ-class molecular chaperone
MRHKQFPRKCSVCNCTGLAPDPTAVYGVRPCDACKGSGTVMLTMFEIVRVPGECSAIGERA